MHRPPSKCRICHAIPAYEIRAALSSIVRRFAANAVIVLRQLAEVTLGQVLLEEALQDDKVFVHEQ